MCVPIFGALVNRLCLGMNSEGSRLLTFSGFAMSSTFLNLLFASLQWRSSLQEDLRLTPPNIRYSPIYYHGEYVILWGVRAEALGCTAKPGILQVKRYDSWTMRLFRLGVKSCGCTPCLNELGSILEGPIRLTAS